MLCPLCKHHYSHLKYDEGVIQGKRVRFGDKLCLFHKKAIKIGKVELKNNNCPVWCPVNPCATTCIICNLAARVNEDGICVRCYKKQRKTTVGWKEKIIADCSKCAHGERYPCTGEPKTNMKCPFVLKDRSTCLYESKAEMEARKL